jgi:TPR repeat protein
MVHLGEIYEKGIGTTIDRVKAIEWYSKASELGDTQAKAKVEELSGGTK